MEFTTKKQLFNLLKNDFLKEMQKKAKEEDFKELYEQINDFLEKAGYDFCISFIETMEKGKKFNWEMITITNQQNHSLLFYHFLIKANEYFEGVEND